MLLLLVGSKLVRLRLALLLVRGMVLESAVVLALVLMVVSVMGLVLGSVLMLLTGSVMGLVFVSVLVPVGSQMLSPGVVMVISGVLSLEVSSPAAALEAEGLVGEFGGTNPLATSETSAIGIGEIGLD